VPRQSVNDVIVDFRADTPALVDGMYYGVEKILPGPQWLFRLPINPVSNNPTIQFRDGPVIDQVGTALGIIMELPGANRSAEEIAELWDCVRQHIQANVRRAPGSPAGKLDEDVTRARNLAKAAVAGAL